MTDMQKLGFTRHPGGRKWTKGHLVVMRDDKRHRPWLAMKNGVLLRAHGDILDSGRVRTFATPEAAARAALERWA